MKKSNIIFAIIVGLLIFYIGNRATELYYADTTADMFTKLNHIANEIDGIFFPIRISLNMKNILGGFAFVGCYAIGILYVISSRHNFMYGVEHGSARWGTSADIAPLIDKNYDNNILLTQTERISLNTRQTFENDNVLVVGGSGSGKTRFFLKPNLMQMHSSYVITDPKGTVIKECGKMLADNGYIIRSLNTVDFSQSTHYNPFAYIHNQEDILVLADLVIKNCGGKDQKEDFWVQAERLLYNAIFGYVFYAVKLELLHPTQKNFATVVKLITAMKVEEDNENFVNPVDMLFEELEAIETQNFAVANYKQYKLAAGKTAKSILISSAIRLQAFNADKIKEITSDDDMKLDEIGNKKTALFFVIDDTSSTYNFLVAMMYTQLFKELCHKASTLPNGRLPIHVRCLLDEFANIGKIPDFEQLIATIRSREISACVILQSFSQIKGLYEKQAGTIIGNCDTFLFLGSSDLETCKEVSEKIGKTTIDHRGSSTQKGMNGSFTVSDQIIGRELITPAEVALLKKNECILQIRGIRPFRSIKFDITQHKNYKLLSDYDSANNFDIKKYWKETKNKDRDDNLEFSEEM